MILNWFKRSVSQISTGTEAAFVHCLSKLWTLQIKYKKKKIKKKK